MLTKMKAFGYKMMILLLYSNLISCDASIKCNGTIHYDDHNVTENDEREKKLDICIGGAIKLICQLDEISLKNGCLASNLAFDFGVGDRPPENATIELINDAQLVLEINTSESDDFTVTCRYNEIGLNSLVMSVNVGRKPQPIEMQCLMYPQQKLQCEFEMSGNPVLEKYDIFYSNRSTQPAVYSQAVFEMKAKKRSWTIKLAKHIEQFDAFGNFTFLVNGTNRFGELHQMFTFQTKQIVVVSAKERHAEIRTIKSKSVVVRIVLPAIVKMYEFNYYVTACIRARAPCYAEESWLPVDVTYIACDANKTDFNINLNVSLPHAYQTYKLKITVRVKDALYPVKQQITIQSKTFQTPAFPPEHPPVTFPNGFEICANNDVLVYWMEIWEMHKNGPDFTYKIFVNGSFVPPTVVWTVLSNSTGRLQNLDRTKTYTIQLVSQNSAGLSTARSNVIQIPGTMVGAVLPPVHMAKTIRDGIYLLSWESSPSPDVVSYTIFWCSPLDEQESMCASLLGRETLPKNQTTFLSPKTQMISFAIAANTETSSSGLFWFKCQKTYSLKVTDRTDSRLTLNWTIPCNTNITHGFNISFCEADTFANATCRTNMINVPLLNINNRESVILSNLTQCTWYIIQMQNSHDKTTQLIKEMTYRGEPPTPIALKSDKITNTTVDILWSLPYECPGTQTCKIIYNKLDPITFDCSEVKSYTIDKLKSFSSYTIKLAICYGDKECSAYSNTINVKTKYGTPAGIDKLTNKINENGLTYYSWESPVENAEFQYYQIRHTVTLEGQNTEQTSIVSDPTCTLVRSPCDGITNYTLFVRVINIDRLSTVSSDRQMSTPTICLEDIPYSITSLCASVSCLIGEWGKHREFHCSADGMIMKLGTILGMALALGAGLIAGTIVGVRKLRSIKNVGHVSLPDGLDSIFKFGSKPNLNQKLEAPNAAECDTAKEEYCTYDYLFSSAYRLDRISVTESIATLENQEDYLEYSCEVVPLPILGNYVKFNDLQNQQKLPASGYTAISALQSNPSTARHEQIQEEIKLSNMQHLRPNQNGYLPVSAVATIATTPAPKTNESFPMEKLNRTKPQVAFQSNTYTPVSTLQHSTMMSSNFSTNGYITIAALQSQSH